MYKQHRDITLSECVRCGITGIKGCLSTIEVIHHHAFDAVWNVQIVICYRSDVGASVSPLSSTRIRCSAPRCPSSARVAVKSEADSPSSCRIYTSKKCGGVTLERGKQHDIQLRNVIPIQRDKQVHGI